MREMEYLGKYRIEAKLGEGAMGFVYKAWHPGFNDYVALKTIQDTRLEGRELLERFKLEGQALAKLKHQNIVQIYDADQADGVHFIAMEYINGGSLDRIISRRDETVTLAKKVSYIVPVCQALEYAHRRRLYHRDIKPANIMLQMDGADEIVKVVDFGIARLVDFSQTQTKLLIGTPAYMAPELITATAKANEKTDIWALGVTLYELITYQRPFTGKSLEELAANIVHGRPKLLTQFVPDCPDDLAAVVDKTLQKDPSSRYQTVEDLLIDLEPIAKRLRTDVAGNLVRRAQDLLEIGEFESAKSALDEARKYDATNAQARSLLQKVEDELRRKELLPRLQEHLRQGRNFLGLGQYREARRAAERAIELDSRFEPAHKLLAEIQEAEAVAEQIQQKLSYAKRSIALGELTEASRRIEEILSLDPDNQEAADLGVKVRSRRSELERRKKLNQHLRATEDLLIVGKYDECISLVNEALRDFPENKGLLTRRENALAEKNEQLRQSLLNKAKRLRVSQQFDQALEALDELLAKFPEDSAGSSLRIAIQKERDQEYFSSQLGQAWEELRSLRDQGRFSQALDRARELIDRFPAEERISEFAKELEANIRLNEMHVRLDATVNQIQSFIRDGAFSRAIRAAEGALKEFPGNPQLLSLQNEAKSHQHREEIVEKQNECVRRVRELISGRQYELAADRARRGLAEYGDHPPLRQALEDAERHGSLHIAKVRQQEILATKIQQSCDSGDVAAATRILQSARSEGLLDENTTLEMTLLQCIDRAREREQKERDVQIELKRREVRQAADQKEFSTAIRLADELERDFGPDREASDLRRKAESGWETEKVARREQEAVLRKISELLNSGHSAAADLMLRNSIEAGLLNKAEGRVASLLEKTKQILDLDKERKQRLHQVTAELQKLLARHRFAEVIDLGQRVLDSDGHSTQITDLIRQAKTALAEEESQRRRRNAELQTIRALIEEGNPQQAKTVMDQAVQCGALDGREREVAELRTKLAGLLERELTKKLETRTALLRSAVSEPTIPEPVPAKPAEEPTEGAEKPHKNWLVVAAAVMGGFAVVAIGWMYWIRPHHFPPPPQLVSDEEFWDKAETAMRQSPEDFKEALAEYGKVSALNGPHKSMAQQKIREIQEQESEEEQMLEQGQLALKASNYDGAIDFCDKVIAIDGERKTEAEALRRIAESAKRGKNADEEARDELGRAEKLFRDGKWQEAKSVYQQVEVIPGASVARRTEANKGLERVRLYEQEDALWNRGLEAENANRLADARAIYQQIDRMGLSRKVEAEGRIKNIDARVSASKFETAWQDLKGRVERSKESQDRSALVALEGELKPFLGADNPHRDEAAGYERMITTSLGNLDYEAGWKRISDQCEQTLKTINKGNLSDADKGLLGQMLDKLNPYLNGQPHRQEAKQYADSIDKILHPVLPPPPPAEGLSAEDKVAIQHVLDEYAHGFNSHKMKDIKEVWPGIPSDLEKRIEGAWGNSKKQTIEIIAQTYEKHGTGWLVTCQQTLRYEKDPQQAAQELRPNIYVIKIQGRWRISDIPQSGE